VGRYRIAARTVPKRPAKPITGGGHLVTIRAGCPSSSRAWCWLKQWRGVATRYDEKSVNDRGGVILASLIIWLRS
jgi:transposase